MKNKKIQLLLTSFFVLVLSSSYAYAGALGARCWDSDSYCDSGYCANEAHSGSEVGVCMPSSVLSDTVVNINAGGQSQCGNSLVGVNFGNGQSQHDNYHPQASWTLWLSGFYGGMDLYYAPYDPVTGDTYTYYKITDGTNFWYASQGVYNCPSGWTIDNAIYGLISKTGVEPACGDSICNSNEDCSSCPSDCPTASGKVCCSGTQYTGNCCSSSDCSPGQTCSSYSCVVSGPACGNGVCESGETCSSCSTDCGSCQQQQCATGCPDSWKGDGTCDSACNNAECNYDSGDCETQQCTCTTSWLGDGTCDTACNNAACNYDNGDCETQQCTCTTSWLGDGTCDTACNIAECNYDNGDCNECSTGCPARWLADGACDSACNNAECNYDSGDCETQQCTCTTSWLGDGTCDTACNNAACNYDSGDCETQQTQQPCATGCPAHWLADGACDSACNNAACNYDNGDCETQQTQQPSQEPEQSALLNAFYERYSMPQIRSASGEYTSRSSFYNGLSTFYERQANEIDIPVAGVGKFTLILDDISDMARSVVSVNPISLSTEMNEFMDDISTKVSQPSKLQNIMIQTYSIGSLGLEAVQRSGAFEEGLAKLSAKLPGNKITQAISQRQAALQQKILPDKASQSHLFLIEAADFVMDQTLMSDVKAEFDYGMVDYTQKIQLSVLARELSKLYEKAEAHITTEKEAVALMIMERDFWTLVIARNENAINNERTAGFLKRTWNSAVQKVLFSNQDDNIDSAQDVINTARQWLDNRNRAINEVFGR